MAFRLYSSSDFLLLENITDIEALRRIMHYLTRRLTGPQPKDGDRLAHMTTQEMHCADNLLMMSKNNHLLRMMITRFASACNRNDATVVRATDDFNRMATSAVQPKSCFDKEYLHTLRRFSTVVRTEGFQYPQEAPAAEMLTALQTHKQLISTSSSKKRARGMKGRKERKDEYDMVAFGSVQWTVSERERIFELLSAYMSEDSIEGKYGAIDWEEFARRFNEGYETRQYPAGEMIAESYYGISKTDSRMNRVSGDDAIASGNKWVKIAIRPRRLQLTRSATERTACAIKRQIGKFTDPKLKKLIADAKAGDRRYKSSSASFQSKISAHPNAQSKLSRNGKGMTQEVDEDEDFPGSEGNSMEIDSDDSGYAAYTDHPPQVKEPIVKSLRERQIRGMSSYRAQRGQSSSRAVATSYLEDCFIRQEVNDREGS